MTTAPSERTRVRRGKHKARYDRETVHDIFDEAMISYIGFVEGGSPFVMPSIHARVGDTLYFHGSAANRTLRTMRNGADVAVTATIIDGVVVARSVFHHSMHYRSAMIFGTGRAVDTPEEREIALRAIANTLLPGRWDEARRPSRNEDKGTLVVAVSIEEFSAKVGDADVGDEDEDYDLPVWAGVIPLSLTAGAIRPDDRLPADVDVPPSVRAFLEHHGG